MEPFVVSNNLLDNPDALRARADRDGYLFLEDLVDRDPILETRKDMAAVLQEVGWIDSGTDPLEAITSHPAHVPGDPEHKPVYDRIMCLESFHTLAHDRAIWGLMEVLLGPDILLLPSNVARMIFPSATEHTTPAHQDYIHIQGTSDVWTAWMPLGACPHSLGGLSVLTGSHKLGILPVSRSLGAGGLKSHTGDVDGEWVFSPFGLGDVLFFHSHTVHRGLPNLSGNRLRLSVDYRYQRASDPVSDMVLTPHQGRLTWDEVYRDWKSDEFQYHWRKYDLTPVPKVPVTPVEEAS